MRFGRVIFLIALAGLCAIAAKADSTDTSSGVLADPTIIFHGSPCGEPYCADLTYTGSSGIQDVLLLVPPTPPAFPGAPFGELSSNPPPFYCTSDIPALIVVLGNNIVPSKQTEFYGCSFLVDLTQGESYTIWSSAPIQLTYQANLFSCDSGNCGDGLADLAPELGTAPLFMTGLLLLALTGFARKRFGANFVP